MSEYINENTLDGSEDETQIAQLFANYLDGKLSANEQASFEQIIADKPIWQARFNAAYAIAHQAQLTEEQNVPKWDRASTFYSSQRDNFPKNSWWQWQGSPVMAMAFSCFAVALVIFKVDIQLNEQGLLVSFANTSKTQTLSDEKLAALVAKQVNEKVDQKLREFASEQQVVLANFSADIRVKQQENNLQLASYLMATARKERKEDIGDFISYVNEQNRADNAQQTFELQQLKYAIENKKLKQVNQLQPANYKLED